MVKDTKLSSFPLPNGSESLINWKASISIIFISLYLPRREFEISFLQYWARNYERSSAQSWIWFALIVGKEGVGMLMPSLFHRLGSLTKYLSLAKKAAYCKAIINASSLVIVRWLWVSKMLLFSNCLASTAFLSAFGTKRNSNWLPWGFVVKR